MRCFEGTRAIFDPMGIRKPLFNGFEMLARLGSERLAATTDDTREDIAAGDVAGMYGGRRPLDTDVVDERDWWTAIQPYPTVDVLAARGDHCIQVLLWNQVSDQ
jgi:hypothetical protein